MRELFKFLVVRYVDLEKENKTINHNNKLMANKLDHLSHQTKSLKEENASLKQRQLITQKQLEKIQRDLNYIRSGLSFRLGRVITYIPRTIRDWYHKKKSK